ncbi:MAG: hypothetical protein K8R46_10395, partial [Pirellulales bacterium]|nr:hypothetical protein [Pirellulales bacterium]
MSTAKPATMTLAFHDQSIGLIIFGVFQILLGCTVGLRALLLAVYAAKGPLFHPGVEAMRTEMLVPGAVTFYLLPAVIFIWLGIGSIRARRWACTLTVILSWLWLIMGLFMTILQVVFAPLIFEWIGRYHGKISCHDIGLLQVREMANMAGIYVLLPIAFLLFYQRMAVRATCHWRDLRGSWTDRCPMPVLAMSILLATSVLWMSWWVVYCCLMAFFPRVQLPDWYALLTTFHLVMSFGGTIPIALGTLLFLLIMVLSVYLAWGIYRRRMDAWWGTLCFC